MYRITAPEHFNVPDCQLKKATFNSCYVIWWSVVGSLAACQIAIILLQDAGYGSLAGIAVIASSIIVIGLSMPMIARIVYYRGRSNGRRC